MYIVATNDGNGTAGLNDGTAGTCGTNGTSCGTAGSDATVGTPSITELSQNG